MELPALLIKTILLRPYVFLFLAAFLFAANRLLGWRRTLAFLFIGWVTAFLCEFSSTRNGFPFGSYYYTGSTVGQELYIANVPFMDSLSFTFLLYASYCLSLLFVLPSHERGEPAPPRLIFETGSRTSWPVLCLTVLFYMFIDVIIDPVALRGDRWFLGQIYGYTSPGIYFGVPLENFLGWGFVGLVALGVYFAVDRRLTSIAPSTAPRASAVTPDIVLGCGLYYGVLLFNLIITFWIGEALLGLVGVFIYLPVTAFVCLRLLNHLPRPARG